MVVSVLLSTTKIFPPQLRQDGVCLEISISALANAIPEKDEWSGRQNEVGHSKSLRIARCQFFSFKMDHALSALPLDALQNYDGDDDIDLASSTKPATQSKKYAAFDLKFKMQTFKTDNKSKISNMSWVSIKRRTDCFRNKIN